MSDDLALLIVIGAVAAICWLSRRPAWRRCRCGASYCNGCNRRGN